VIFLLLALLCCSVLAKQSTHMLSAALRIKQQRQISCGPTCMPLLPFIEASSNGLLPALLVALGLAPAASSCETMACRHHHQQQQQCKGACRHHHSQNPEQYLASTR
jgi:hypothetical protein